MSEWRRLWKVVVCRMVGHDWKHWTKCDRCDRCHLLWGPLIFGFTVFED